MVAVRKHRKMSLLTELEILSAGFLQRWRAYGAGEYTGGIRSAGLIMQVMAMECFLF